MVGAAGVSAVGLRLGGIVTFCCSFSRLAAVQGSSLIVSLPRFVRYSTEGNAGLSPAKKNHRAGARFESGPFAGDYPGHLGFWVRLSLGTHRAAYCKKPQADALKTLKFSTHDSVTSPDASITSHAASSGAPRSQAYPRAGLLHRRPAAVDGAIVRPTVPGRRAGSAAVGSIAATQRR